MNFVKLSKRLNTNHNQHRKSFQSLSNLWYLAPISFFGYTLSSTYLANNNTKPIQHKLFPFQVHLQHTFADNRSSNRRSTRRRLRKKFGNDLCLAVRQKDYDLVQQLLSRTNTDTTSSSEEIINDPNTRSEYGWSALHIATVNDDDRMVRLLLEYNADPNAKDMTNPYMNSGVRTRLFSNKIHPNAPTQGWTPLHYAVAFFNAPLVRLLIEHGANPNIRDSNNYLCSDYLNEQDVKSQEMLELLDSEYEQYLGASEERERLRRLQYPIEDSIKEHIVGQLLPIQSVSSAVRRKLNGWHDPQHPLVFLFLGSSGVGKTELAKTLAFVLHGKNERGGLYAKVNEEDPEENQNQNNQMRTLEDLLRGKSGVSNDSLKKESFIRIDMSEFQHKHEVAKFIGSPPGYVGHEQGGQLTSKLKACPNAVVLLDEVEKAHPDVLTVMLQLFDEGRITDGKGETIECKDAIFIMTSNLAQTEIGDEAEELRHDLKRRADQNAHQIEVKSEKNTSIVDTESISLSRQFIEETIQPILKRHFQRDEFLGRINEILYFLPFNEMELKQLTVKELNKWRAVAAERHRIELGWDENAVDLLRDGYNFRYGARSIQHEVEKRVVNQLAKLHEQGFIQVASVVNITADIEQGSIKLECDNSKVEEKKKQKGWLW